MGRADAPGRTGREADGPGPAAAPGGRPGSSAPSAGPAGRAAAPPFRLPGQHFAAALGFLLLGSVGLAWRAPALAAGAFSDPGVVAVTHLFTLGWISTTIMGALYQFLPVALGASVRWEGLADATFAAWVAGVATFSAGLLLGQPRLHVPGAAILGLAVLLFAANVAATLPRATRRGLTWWCAAGATLFLAGAWLLGLLLAVNLGTGILGGTRFTVVAVHLHIAAGGWVLLTMIGVAHHLLPMFLLSHGAPEWPGKAAAFLVAAGAAGFLASEHVVGVAVLRPAGGLLAAGALLFVAHAALHYRARRRPRLDPGMQLVAGALALLAAAVAVGVAGPLLPGGAGSGAEAARWWTAYGVLLVAGGLGLFVAGHYYKILPFLTWFHRYGPVAAERDVPQVGELFRHGPARAAGLLLAAGAAGAGAAVLAGSPGGTRVAALAYAAGAGLMAAQMLGIARRRPA